MNHEGRLLKKETTIGKTQQFALAQRVTRNDASNVQLGCSLRSELKLDVVGRDVQPTLEKPCNPSRANPAAGLFISELALTPGSGPEPQAAPRQGLRLGSLAIL